MAGEHRRTRCDNCKRLFQFAIEGNCFKVSAYLLSSIEKRVFCSSECAIEGIKNLERLKL